MNVRKALVVLGVGATTFLVVTGTAIELLGGDFPSALIALPIGVLVGLGGAGFAFLRLDGKSSRPTQSGAAAIATVAYVLLGLWFLRYSVAAVRPVLAFTTIIAVSVLAAVAVGIASWVRHPVLREAGEVVAKTTGGRIDTNLIYFISRLFAFKRTWRAAR